MKKTLLAAALLLTSLSANAYRQEYGTFGGWDAYYLNTGSQEVCASRGFFDNGYKVIFNWSKENNIHTLSINLEHYGWSIPPGRYAAQVVTYGFSGELLKTAIAVATNNDTNNVSQISLNIDRRVAYDTIMSIFSASKLTVSFGTSDASFNISDVATNKSLEAMFTCVNEKMAIPKTPTIQPVNPNPFVRF